MNGDKLYVNLNLMFLAEGKIEALCKAISNTSFQYPNPRDYGSDEEYDVSDIDGRKLIQLNREAYTLERVYSKQLRLFYLAHARALEILAKYKKLNFTLPKYKDGQPIVLFVGNSYYYYEGYPHMVKGFLPDINIDTSISSKMGLSIQWKLLEAARKGDKEEYKRIMYEYIKDNVGDEGKIYIEEFLNKQKISEYGSMLDLAYETYRRSATNSHDEVVIEGMGLNGKVNPNDPNSPTEADYLEKIIMAEYKKNPNCKIIIDNFGNMSKEEVSALMKRIQSNGKKNNYNIDIKVTNASAIGEQVNSMFDSWNNKAETDGILHPNKILTYIGAKITACYIAADLGKKINENYNGDTRGVTYPDATYGVIQEPRNNYKTSLPKIGSTDSGTADKTDDLMEVTEYRSLVDVVVENNSVPLVHVK